MAYIRRFVYNARHKDRLSGHLSPKELQYSRLFLIGQVQAIFFKSEILSLTQGRLLLNKQIASLNSFIDRSTLLRVGGRLKYSDVPFDQRHPLLLPARNHFTTLLLTSKDQRLGHAGSQTTLNNVRLRYWPLDELKCVKRIIHSCNTYFRFNAIASNQIMGDLPRERVTSKRPFENSGIDFGGPFCIQSSSLRSYIALFVRLATKAVHLEAVSDLTTDSSLACLKRFIARRGIPSIIDSDNGTNFVGANNHLTLLRKHFSTPPHVFHEFLASQNITWKFIPPRSPHWGSLWETSIKSAKSLLIKITGNSVYTFEQFCTILAQVEAVLNSRPLFPLSTDPLDLQPLTPGHFLIGAPLLSYPEVDISYTPDNRLKRW
ncbi:uncharacterized protein [Diabrotica undecimpunctata]|uniref:uncharacterized protein n=1 Tax=Diabrotica undecimpunctata TaxID=50387 RepID=UPI003B6412CE